MKRTLSFDEWLAYVFDHPEEDDDDQKWYFRKDESGQPVAWWFPEPVEIADHLIRLLEAPTQLLDRFSELQIADGLNFVFGAGSACLSDEDDEESWFSTPELGYCPINFLFRAFDERVPRQSQERLIRSIYILFRDLFAPNCTDWFGLNRDEPLPDDPEFAEPLDGICWMLWDSNDLFRIVTVPRCAYLVEPAFGVLRETLALPNAYCQAGALHALGHLQPTFPERVVSIIDNYTARHPQLHPNLRRYAADARSGTVL